MKSLLTLATVGAALAAGFGATPAMAQGGLWAGALAGYQGLHVDAADGSATAKGDAAVYGVNGGYDLSLGQAFVGVEGEVSTSDGSGQFPSTFTGARNSLKASGQYYVGARAGVALTPGIAAYGKVGYTALDTRAFSSAGSLGELKDNSDGIRFGGGLQVDLPGPLEARLEYRRSRYKDAAGGTFGDATTDQVVGGVGVRF